MTKHLTMMCFFLNLSKSFLLLDPGKSLNRTTGPAPCLKGPISSPSSASHGNSEDLFSPLSQSQLSDAPINGSFPPIDPCTFNGE